jgi:hypothetical protein
MRLLWLRERLAHCRNVLWKPLMGKVFLAYALLGIITTSRDEFFKRPPGTVVWRLIDVLPAWSGPTWAIIILVTLLMFSLENSYRHARAMRVAFNKEMEKAIDDVGAIHSAAIAQERRTNLQLASELASERQRNQRPNISVRLVSGIYWSNGDRDQRRSEKLFRTRYMCVALFFEFLNDRPVTGTIDHWTLTISRPGSAPLQAERMPDDPRSILLPLNHKNIPPRDMEQYLKLPQGCTVARWDYFCVEEETELTENAVPEREGLTVLVEMEQPLFSSNREVLIFTAIDSFGAESKAERVVGGWFTLCQE